MHMARNEETACEIAREKRQAYGWSVFSPAWYVGTPAELRAIGCLPEHIKAPTCAEVK